MRVSAIDSNLGQETSHFALINLDIAGHLTSSKISQCGQSHIHLIMLQEDLCVFVLLTSRQKESRCKVLSYLEQLALVLTVGYEVNCGLYC